jgi:hypothetical protein
LMGVFCESQLCVRVVLENWSSFEGDGRLEGKGLHVMNLLLLLLPEL